MRRIFLMIFMGLMSIMASAQTSIQVQTHNVVALDEQFTVAFVIEGKNSPSEFEWEAGDDFDLLWGPQQGRSSSVQIINGKRTESSQTTYSYILRPLKSGKFTLPKARAVVGGKEIYSSAATVEVVGSGSSASTSAQSSSEASSSQSASSSNTSQEVLLALSVDRRNVVVGEPVKAVLKLYQRVDIVGFEGADFPAFDGFWSQETYAPANIQFERESYNGQIYNVAVLREYALVPQHSGKIEISSAELVCLINVRVSSGGPSIMDGFFDEYATVRKKVKSEPVTINVKPLPSGAPETFAGGVGVFNVEASVSRDTLAAHEAATLTIKVSGQGNISLLETPDVSFPQDIESYDPKISGSVSSNGLSGTKIYEYPFIPRSAGTYELGPVIYSYYDVAQQKYVTIDAGSFTLSVERSADYVEGSVPISVISRADIKNKGYDINSQVYKSSGFTKKGDFFVGSGLFWFLLIILCVLALIAWIVLKTLFARRADAVGSKNRKATKMALKRLRFAGHLLGKDQYSAFYEELHKALLGYLSDKLNMPATELSKDRISEVLLHNGVMEVYVNEFIEILDSCEYARYAPSSGNQAMTTDFEKAVEVISTIDSSMKIRKGGAGRYMAVVIFMLCSIGAAASEESRADSLWKAGNAAFDRGEWAQAISDYEAISDMGLESAELYYNIGNAWFRSDNYAEAVLYYERSLRLDPSFSDAKQNLEYVNELLQDKTEQVPEFFLKEWMRDISYLTDSDTWAIVALFMLGVTLVLVLMFLLSASLVWRRVGFFAGICTILLFIASLSFSIWQKNDYLNHDEAIVMYDKTRDKAEVRSSPSSENNTVLFDVHEGTKVSILESMGAWTKISISDGRQGWIRTADIEII
jgi:tetratricopeptide (TPR) repeat protein